MAPQQNNKGAPPNPPQNFPKTKLSSQNSARKLDPDYHPRRARPEPANAPKNSLLLALTSKSPEKSIPFSLRAMRVGKKTSIPSIARAAVNEASTRRTRLLFLSRGQHSARAVESKKSALRTGCRGSTRVCRAECCSPKIFSLSLSVPHCTLQRRPSREPSCSSLAGTR